MAERATERHVLFNGLSCRNLSLPNGDSLLVSLHGAQVLSWIAGGRERLYLSPNSVFDGKAAIRGGIPICFPQFNQRGPLAKHGFARNLSWRSGTPPHLEDQAAKLRFDLSATEASKAVWPHAFGLQLLVELQPGQLQISLEVQNDGPEVLSFTGALHTYLAVNDVGDLGLEGLDGQSEWDAVTDQYGKAQGPLILRGEFDRVYEAAAAALTLHDGAGRLSIEQSPSFANTVVWNPGADKGARLADMPPDGYRRMLCVEAAQVMQPIAVPAGRSWLGWQRLTVE
ncbi:MAG: D-hexose-6-phosphate mutarotase [Gammaproteobacteria bacterium]|nr:D-hexose-6-phosphate mutarotase [Gammaproteobacteria bacterium]